MPRGISLRRINLFLHCVRLSAKYLPVSEKFPHETSRLERLEGFRFGRDFRRGPKNNRLVSAAGETARNNEPTNDTGPRRSRIAYRSASSVGNRVLRLGVLPVAGYDPVYGILGVGVLPRQSFELARHE